MNRVKWYVWVGGVALALLTLSLVAPQRVVRWKERRAAWSQQVKDVALHAKRLEEDNRALRLEIDAFQVTIVRRDTVLQRVVRWRDAVPVPAVCDTVARVRDSLIGLLAADTMDLRSTLRLRQREVANLRWALEEAKVVIGEAGTVLAKAPVTPSFWSKLKPEVRVGVGPAYDLLDRTFHPLTATVSLSWGFP